MFIIEKIPTTIMEIQLKYRPKSMDIFMDEKM